MTFSVLHEDASVADAAIDGALGEIEHVERVMSIYRPESELCRLNRDGGLRDPDPSLVRVLREAMAISGLSGGAFDPTVQPLWKTYAIAKREQRLPTDAELAAATRLCDWRGISASDTEIRLRPGMSLTLNGIAQGFAADRAMEALQRHGIRHALVNAGEITSLGRKSNDDAWHVGIQHPRQKDAYIGVASLDGRCLSTSGDYETAFSADLSSHHIVDPATGRSPNSFSSVTVAAPTATLADALSTAIFVLGPEKGLALAEASPHTDVLLVLADGTARMTRNFPLDSSKEAQYAIG